MKPSLIFRGNGLLFLASSAVALAIHLFGQFTCWADSYVHWGYAKYLLEPLERVDIADRDPLYPILIWLTSVPWQNLRGVLILQMLTAALCPLLVSLTLGRISPRLGLAAGWCALLSFIPFVFQNQLFTDQAHMFLLLLLAWAAVNCLTGGHRAFLYATAAIAGILGFSRPTFWALVPLALAVIVYWMAMRRREHLRFAVPGLIACLIVSGLFYANIALRSLPYAAAPEGSVRTTFAGRQLLFGFWLNAAETPQAFSAADGPATAEFREKALRFFEKCRERRQENFCLHLSLIRKLQQLGQPLPASPEEAFEAFLRHPRYFAWWRFLEGMLDEYGWTQATEEKFMQLYIEQVTHHPGVLLDALRHRLPEVLFASYYHYHAEDDAIGYEDPPGIFLLPALVIQQCLGSEFKPYDRLRFLPPPMAKSAQNFFEWYYRWLTTITGLMALAGAAWFAAKRLRRRGVGPEGKVFLILFSVYWLPLSAMIPLVQIAFRYHATSALLPLMMAAIFIHSLRRSIAASRTP